MNEKQLVEKLRATAPSCLEGCRLCTGRLSKPFDNNPCSVWTIGCNCGGSTGRLLGYSLKDYNKDYVGPECFLSPLAFECNECNKVTEILDTNLHGYHSDVARRSGDDIGSAKLRGEGPRQSFTCTGCKGSLFSITVAFVFWHTDELAEEFEECWEDQFSVFLCECRCVSCGRISRPTNFGKL
jgi:hypothetical protein